MFATCRVCLTGLAPILAGLGSNPALAQCRYTVTQIPPRVFPNGDREFPTATGMNNVGQIVGYYLGLTGETETGFVWSEEEGLRLLPRPIGYSSVVPMDINDLGQVVGWASDGAHRFGFLWNGGATYVDLGYPPGGYLAEASAINNRGQVVGMWLDPKNGPCGFLWESGVLTDLAPVLGSRVSYAEDINERGQITGMLANSYWEDARAYVLSDHKLVILPPAPNCVTSWGRAINQHGDVCGTGTNGYPGNPGTYSRGFAWFAGVMHAVEPLGGHPRSRALDIDSRGQVVGVSGTPYEDQAVLWRAGETFDLAPLIDLPAPLFVYGVAGIDSYGRIAATGIDTFYTAGGAMLTPVEVPGDTTGDCHVDWQDLIRLLAEFGCQNVCGADTDGDRDVDIADLVIVLSRF